MQKIVTFKRYFKDSQISCYRMLTRAPLLTKQMCWRPACLDQLLAPFVFTPCTIHIQEFIYTSLVYDTTLIKMWLLNCLTEDNSCDQAK